MQSSIDDDGELGVDDEFDVYEELQLESMNAEFEYQRSVAAGPQPPLEPEPESKGKSQDTVESEIGKLVVRD